MTQTYGTAINSQKEEELKHPPPPLLTLPNRSYSVIINITRDKTQWSVHFDVVVVELINCKCGGIVTVRNEI